MKAPLGTKFIGEKVKVYFELTIVSAFLSTRSEEYAKDGILGVGIKDCVLLTNSWKFSVEMYRTHTKILGWAYLGYCRFSNVMVIPDKKICPGFRGITIQSAPSYLVQG